MTVGVATRLAEKAGEVHPERNPVLRIMRRFVPMSSEYHGQRRPDCHCDRVAALEVSGIRRETETHRQIKRGTMSTEGPLVTAYDGSPGSDAALRMALDLGARARLPVLAVYVFESLDHLEDVPPPVDFAERRAASTEEIQAHLDEFAPDIEVELEVVDGIAGGTLLDAATSHHASMIVTGTRRRRALTELVLGSVARYLIANADRPVLVVPPPAD